MKYGIEFMLFIKACRYYGLMKNDMALDDKNADAGELNRDARVIQN